MSAPEKPNPTAPHATTRPSRLPRGPEAAFDIFLKRQLHEAIDEDAREPIPDVLVALIQKMQPEA